MANARWSASRFNCYKGCKVNYLNTYIRELVVLGKESELQTKGLSFHEIAELMDSKKTLKQITKIAEKVLKEYSFDQEKYPVIKAIPKFYMFWQEYVKKWEEQGFKIFKEQWEYSSLEKKSIVGALDLLLINEETKEAIIIDYKSGGTAKISGYEGQLLLYAYMIKNRLKTKYDKIKMYVFFPLAGLKDEDGTEETSHKLMLKSLKEFIFSEDDVKNILEEFKGIIKSSDEEDWENLDLEKNSNMSFACSWCAFAGHPVYCPTSNKAGVLFPRKAKVITKEEAKKLQEEKKDKAQSK